MRLPGKVGEILGVDIGNFRRGLRVALAASVSANVSITVFLVLMPLAMVNASPNIVRAVETFCAPQPTQPPVSSCSTCHSSSDKRGLNDLTVSGQWSISSATYRRFCPATVSETPQPINPPSSSSNFAVSGIGGMLSRRSNSIGMGPGAPLFIQP